jgi:hypothetical protein
LVELDYNYKLARNGGRRRGRSEILKGPEGAAAMTSKQGSS